MADSPSNSSVPDTNSTSFSDMVDSTWNVLASTSIQAFNSAMEVLEESYPLCKKLLDHKMLFPERDPNDTRIWCNATYDTVLCWPPTPANSSVTLQCPHMKGLDPNKYIEKRCDETGRWAGKSAGHYENPWGWTNFTVCFKIDYEDVKNITKDCHVSGVWSGRIPEEMGPSLPGWTNFTMCYTDEVIYIMQNLNNESLTIAQEVARNARKLEFVGLGLSLVSLILAISIFSYFRRLRVFRNLSRRVRDLKALTLTTFLTS